MYDDFFLQKEKLKQTYEIETGEIETNLLMQFDKAAAQQYFIYQKQELECQLRYHIALAVLIREEVEKMNQAIYLGSSLIEGGA